MNVLSSFRISFFKINFLEIFDTNIQISTNYLYINYYLFVFCSS